MFRFTRRMILVMVILAATLWPTLSASANPAVFEFVGVDTACQPGSIPTFTFIYGAEVEEVVYHVWTLENTRTGTTTGPWSSSNLYGSGEVYLLTTEIPTPIPDDTLPGDTLVARVETRVAYTHEFMSLDEYKFRCGSTAGCALPIPETAVVGEFSGNTTTYWQPGYMTSPEVVIEVGKTAWTLGVDETGAFRKIIWACQYLWVPEGSMGPHYDDVWNGQPLPLDVVE